MSSTAKPATSPTAKTAKPKTRPATGTSDATSAAPELGEEQRARIDAAIEQLRAGARSWSHLTLGQRARLLERLHASVSSAAADWADAASTSKGLGAGHPLRGEEWLSGPYAALVALDAYRRSLTALAQGRSPLDGIRTDEAPGGRIRAHTFPTNAVDGLLLSGYTGEVWFEPGVTAVQARRGAGLGQLDPTRPAEVGLVLGAGNITSIPVLDVLYELLAHNRVCVLKVNPTQDALVPVYERAFAPLIEAGFLRILTGGGDVGAYLTQHPSIAHVHITGSAATFDLIAWGPGPSGARRRREKRPQLKKPITAELGGVSPIIVVPGRWTAADLAFHAEHVVTMRLHNSGHNCIAGQVVILSADWPQREAFLDALRTAYDTAPTRPVWYPKSAEKMDAAAAAYPRARWNGAHDRAIIEIGPGDDASDIETTEYFSPVLGVVALPGNGQEFLDAAVRHANDKLTGTLGANVLIDPLTQAALGDGFERAIADLHYGDIAINAWTGFAFLTPTLTWGAYPGSTVEDVGSGIGVVHNALLLDRVERSVARGPFRPFPRSLRHPRALGLRKLSVLPKPPWFVTSRTGAQVGEGFTRFRIDGHWGRLAGTLVKAFRA